MSGPLFRAALLVAGLGGAGAGCTESDAEPAPATGAVASVAQPASSEPAEAERAEPASSPDRAGEAEDAAPAAKDAEAEPVTAKEPGKPEPAEDEPERPAVAELGDLLPGDEELPVMQVTLVRTARASKRFGPRATLLDRVDATLSPTAKVGDVNEALEATGARVCKIAGPGIPFTVMLCIPPQKDRAAVQAVASRLQAFSAITHAQPITGAPPNVVAP